MAVSLLCSHAWIMLESKPDKARGCESETGRGCWGRPVTGGGVALITLNIQARPKRIVAYFGREEKNRIS